MFRFRSLIVLAAVVSICPRHNTLSLASTFAETGENDISSVTVDGSSGYLLNQITSNDMTPAAPAATAGRRQLQGLPRGQLVAEYVLVWSFATFSGCFMDQEVSINFGCFSGRGTEFLGTLPNSRDNLECFDSNDGVLNGVSCVGPFVSQPDVQIVVAFRCYGDVPDDLIAAVVNKVQPVNCVGAELSVQPVFLENVVLSTVCLLNGEARLVYDFGCGGGEFLEPENEGDFPICRNFPTCLITQGSCNFPRLGMFTSSNPLGAECVQNLNDVDNGGNDGNDNNNNDNGGNGNNNDNSGNNNDSSNNADATCPNKDLKKMCLSCNKCKKYDTCSPGWQYCNNVCALNECSSRFDGGDAEATTMPSAECKPKVTRKICKRCNKCPKFDRCNAGSVFCSFCESHC